MGSEDMLDTYWILPRVQDSKRKLKKDCLCLTLLDPYVGRWEMQNVHLTWLDIAIPKN